MTSSESESSQKRQRARLSFSSKKPSATRRSAASSCPPYNPDLHQLIQAKKAWAEPLEQDAVRQGFLGWHQRGYLPHRDVPGIIQLVTFRLHDSFPAARLQEWKVLLRIEDSRQRRSQLERYLDRGHGSCWLRQAPIAGIAEGALRHFDHQRYDLLAWVIMPNHVHVLVHTRQTPLPKVIQSWKSYIAREANIVLRRQGAFWERDYWDTYMRDEAQVIKSRSYVDQNPVKAGLVRDATAWGWSSARFRDLYGRLPGEQAAQIIPRC